jgi:hypothetical protein
MKAIALSLAALALIATNALAQHKIDVPTPDVQVHCQREGSLGSKAYIECRLRLEELTQCYEATEIKLGMKPYLGQDQIFHEEAGCIESVYRRYPNPKKAGAK